MPRLIRWAASVRRKQSVEFTEDVRSDQAAVMQADISACFESPAEPRSGFLRLMAAGIYAIEPQCMFSHYYEGVVIIAGALLARRSFFQNASPIGED